MDYDDPELGSKDPFYYEFVEVKPCTITTENSRVGIQIELMITFLKRGDELWGLEDFWTQIGVWKDILLLLLILVGSPSELLLVGT